MAIIKKWSGDGLSPGVVTSSTAGAGDSPFNGFNGDPGGTYPNVVASGPRSPQLEFPTTNSKSAAPFWDMPVQTRSAGRFYFTTPSAWNSASHSIAQVTSGSSTLCARINISGSSAPGQLRIVNSASTQVAATASNTLALSTRYRVEWTLNQATGFFEVRLFVGDSEVIAANLSATSNYGATADRVVFGNYSTAAVPLMQYDDFAISDTDSWIGPFSSEAPTVTTTLWNGSAEIPITAALWNGSAEIPLH